MANQDQEIIVSRKNELEQAGGFALNVDQALQQYQAYIELTNKMLQPEDFQEIGGKKYKKKSAYRKYANAFKVSVVDTTIEIHRDDSGRPVWAQAIVWVETRDGRRFFGTQECHLHEKCCPAFEGQVCNKKGYHTHCAQGCNGYIHFAHPGDIPATAYTRALNRAVSDAIGSGEVSAEEMEGVTGEPSEQQPSRSDTPRTKDNQPELPDCPECGKMLRQDKKVELRYYCWKAKGGCGEAFRVNTETGELTNEKEQPKASAQKPANGNKEAEQDPAFKSRKEKLVKMAEELGQPWIAKSMACLPSNIDALERAVNAQLDKQR